MQRTPLGKTVPVYGMQKLPGFPLFRLAQAA